MAMEGAKKLDYRRMLWLYIRHVGSIEGVSFLERHNLPIEGMTAEETDAIIELDTLVGERNEPEPLEDSE